MSDLVLACIESRVESDGCLYGRFFLGPLYGGQGVTVGNGLRRWLLSQVAGVGIAYVVIQGIKHQFCSIRGVSEPVLDILFNLKGVVVYGKLAQSTSPFGVVQAQGPGVVCAGDIRLPQGLRVANPAKKIATLSSEARLNMRVALAEATKADPIASPSPPAQLTPLPSLSSLRKSVKMKGRNVRLRNWPCRGWEPLPVESLLMPVVRANYRLENDGGEEHPRAQERLVLEIWTNGSVHPRQALSDALVEWTALLIKVQRADVMMFSGGNRFPLSFNTVCSSACSMQSLQEKGGYPYWRVGRESLPKGGGTTQPLNDRQGVLGGKQPRKAASQSGKGGEMSKGWADLDICNLELSVITYLALKRAGISSVFDLISRSSKELLSLDMIDSLAVREIQANLGILGVELANER